jgi:predicted nucleic acid-binding protein
MPFVLDTSVAMAWAFDDQDHPNAIVALKRIRKDRAHVPSLWWYEVRNVLIIGERRRRLTEADTALFLRALSRFDIAVDPLPDEARVLAIARRHRLTVYDAVYLELAQREEIPLATLDKELARAAIAEDVRLIDDRSV